MDTHIMEEENDKHTEEETRQVQVQFTMKLHPALRVATSSIAILVHLTIYGLSDIINTLIDNGNFPGSLISTIFSPKVDSCSSLP
jgi:hypothetical protein